MIKFPPLTEAVFVERINRFAVRVIVDGKSAMAHLDDPGRLQELLIPGVNLMDIGGAYFVKIITKCLNMS
jgi:sugar fermentation stimulation protein A